MGELVFLIPIAGSIFLILSEGWRGVAWAALFSAVYLGIAFFLDWANNRRKE